MLSDKLVRQEFAVRILKTHLEESHLAHTYLFAGEEQSGKEELALGFAAALNCEKKYYFKPCECNSCRKIAGGGHPDVRLLGRDEKARSIKIEEVRDAIAAAALKPYEGQWKVFILPDADRLTMDASNAFLKTLEEPPAHTIFILLVEHKGSLLDTIQSRSFEVRLRPASAGEQERNPMAAEILQAMRGKPLDEFLDEYQTVPRDKLKDVVDFLMVYYRGLLENQTRGGAALPSYVKAIDLLLETKEALESNANQKLALSRLGMQLGKLQLSA